MQSVYDHILMTHKAYDSRFEKKWNKGYFNVVLTDGIISRQMLDFFNYLILSSYS